MNGRLPPHVESMIEQRRKVEHEHDVEHAAVDELIAACELLIEQYEAVPEFTMGGQLTNEPFTRIAAALARVGGRP